MDQYPVKAPRISGYRGILDSIYHQKSSSFSSRMEGEGGRRKRIDCFISAKNFQLWELHLQNLKRILFIHAQLIYHVARFTNDILDFPLIIELTEKWPLVWIISITKHNAKFAYDILHCDHIRMNFNMANEKGRYDLWHKMKGY